MGCGGSRQEPSYTTLPDIYVGDSTPKYGMGLHRSSPSANKASSRQILTIENSAVVLPGREAIQDDWAHNNNALLDHEKECLSGHAVRNWDNGDIYEGEWVKGKRHGKGKMVWSNGQSYSGQWVLDQMEGEGEYKWPDGQIYIGEFKSGKREGKGVIEFAGGEKKFVGTFVANERRGSGVWYLPGGIRKVVAE